MIGNKRPIILFGHACLSGLAIFHYPASKRTIINYFVVQKKEESTTGLKSTYHLSCPQSISINKASATPSFLFHLIRIRTFNRYYAIVRPLEYPLNMTHKTVCFMLANVWILPALISFTPIFLGWYTTEEHLREVSLHPDQCSFVVNKAYALISSSVSFWIPGIVMLVMYWRIFK